jgi:uncharacterized protein YukE
MAGLIGADVEALERLAADFDHGAQELRDLSAQIAGSIEAAHDWHGPDADRCKTEWGTFAQERMTGVSDALATAGRLLAQNAQEQEQASGVGTTATSAFGLLALARDVVSIFKTGKKVFKAVQRALNVATFLQLLRAAKLGDVAAAGRAAALLDKFKFGSGGLLGKLFLPLTVFDGAKDVLTGGGYEGWRDVASRGFGAGAVVGGVALLVGGAAIAPFAAGAVAAYGLWKAGNAVYDNWDTIRDRTTQLWGAVSERAGRVWEGAGTHLDSALTWARGLLGGPRLAGAGA